MSEFPHYLKQYNKYLLSIEGNLHKNSNKYIFNDTNNKLSDFLLDYQKTTIYYMKLLEKSECSNYISKFVNQKSLYSNVKSHMGIIADSSNSNYNKSILSYFNR